MTKVVRTLGDEVEQGFLSEKEAALIALCWIRYYEELYGSSFVFRMLRGFKPPRLAHLKSEANFILGGE